ncbi:MAG TPA: glycoside hydrolase family 3 N-terminal domain-containing protein [Ktedonobacteraceae bacterium]
MSTTQNHPANSLPSAGLDHNPQPTPQPPRIRHGRRNLTFGIALSAILLLIVTLSGSAASYFLLNKAPTVTPTPTISANGPFVTLPLSQSAIYQIQHLPEEMQAQELARIYVSHMTLSQKLGQLFMVQALTQNNSANTPDTMYMLNQLHAGGIIMYAIQMNTLKQTKGDIQAMQLNASIPLLVSTDEEGGLVERVQNIFGNRPGALETYQTGKVSNAIKLGNGIAHDLQELGINTDLAPDMDVLQVKNSSSYMDTRTWGYTPDSVITYGGAYLRTVQGDNEIACLKHFPGLGAAKTDAHTSLPIINSSKEKIYATDLAPYKYFLSSSNSLDMPGMIMTTDLLMPALDPQLPAELSPTIINGILRAQLHYNGVVITDALWMDGISKKWDLVQASIMALLAGDDMLLGNIGKDQMIMIINGLKNALQDGQLSMSRINEAVTRIITLKFQYHLLRAPWY